MICISPVESRSGGLLLEAGYIVTGTCMASHDFQNSRPPEGNQCPPETTLPAPAILTQVYKYPYQLVTEETFQEYVPRSWPWVSHRTGPPEDILELNNQA